MRYYLIDYENVNAAGLEGIEEVTSGSRVVIFYTKNSSKIDLGLFNMLRGIDAELAVIEVHHGKQALDIQLASYVGFLIGTEPSDTEYFIVSKDKGYRNIQDFWSDRRIVLCTSLREDSEIIDEPKPAKTSARSSSRNGRSRSSRSNAKADKAEQKSEPAAASEAAEEEKPKERPHERKRIQTKAEKNTKRDRSDHSRTGHAQDEAKAESAPAETKAEPAPAEVKAEPAPAEEKARQVQAETAAKTEAAESKADKPAPPRNNAFAEAAALAAAMAARKEEERAAEARQKEEAAEKEKKAAEKEAAEKEAGAKEKETAKKGSGAKEKKAAKKEVPAKEEEKKAAGKETNAEPKQKASELRNEVNTEIQKLLSKEGFAGDIINATASFVSKNIGKDGYKQLIYRGIIKDHGQKQGLAIYRLIKELL